MKIINIQTFYWQQMSNTVSNTVTPHGDYVPTRRVPDGRGQFSAFQ